jgi:hypothetical protein
MAKSDNDGYEVGYGKPPRSTQFKPRQSGNLAGRPRGAKNFATALEQELENRVTIAENGKSRRVSKRQVIAKQLVNKAAGGDLKAIPLLLNEARAREANPASAQPEEVFDTPEDRKVLDGIIARIRSSLPEGGSSSPMLDEGEPNAIRPSNETEE